MSDSAKTQLLLMDDDDDLREVLCAILEAGDFQVFPAANVNAAVKLIGTHTFDVLVSDLHMPNEGDGLTVVSAMRHSNAKALTVIFSAHPEMKAAAAAIVAQTDEILVKPSAIADLVLTIRQKMKNAARPARVVSSVATILEEEAGVTIKHWLARADAEERLLSVHLSDETRSAHLPQVFSDLVHRLRSPLALGTHASTSPAAAQHGRRRREQGYTAAMMVEESRMLQVSIFQTLQNNLHRVNFSSVLTSVMTIADEVDSQLAQAMTAYTAEAEVHRLPN